MKRPSFRENILEQHKVRLVSEGDESNIIVSQAPVNYNNNGPYSFSRINSPSNSHSEVASKDNYSIIMVSDTNNMQPPF